MQTNKLSDAEHVPAARTTQFFTDFSAFCAADINVLDAQRRVISLGEVIGEWMASQGQDAAVLCPIMRAALPFAIGVAASFPARAIRPIRISRAAIDAGAGLDTHFADIPSGTVLLIDTVTATGKTLSYLAKEIQRHQPGCRIIATVAYASPQALTLLERESVIDHMWVGHLSDSVDSNGYLIPPTNGDTGDKLFDGMM
ncbi:hypothetical protein KY495_03665 [Massilia sp. PAMC28688]|uniref:uracil phosphoribosyltransferase n=1 Tax=Massilia sp. PAMC28688 TaxID=2861283 RepID=UPI001C63003A|nr:uracil phosphoribosyltransferase [Massilia sp. PAMC28688]QYF94327.1 hypothetical protein KY495_03665 [Massilia sp. PAMC28688]